MPFHSIKYIHFIGIGGIGMSALARYFKTHGVKVSGYDKTPTTLTDELIAEGIDIHFKDEIGLIDKKILGDDGKIDSIIIYTPAIPKEHSELNFFRQNGYTLYKRSEVLGLITKNNFTIAVAGTHGKTTTSSMIAHLLTSSGLNCTAFLGGISKNFNSNLVIAKPEMGKTYFVVEADEYDRSFLTLHPDISVITSMDADHLDIYSDVQYMQDSYRMFASQLKPGGSLVHRVGLPLGENNSFMTYTAQPADAAFRAEHISVSGNKFLFDWTGNGETIRGIVSRMPGHHNVENAVAAIAVARMLGISKEQVQEGMSTYLGVKRRFDFRYESPSRVYIDDYAHHPEELRSAISSARLLYPGKNITGIFQPHLYSRTRDFAGEFAESLSMLDSLILLDIYPAREKPIEGVTSQLIFDEVTIGSKVMCRKEDVIAQLGKNENGVVMTLGAGDIDTLVAPIEEWMSKKDNG